MKSLWRSRNAFAFFIVCALLRADWLFAASLSVNGSSQYISALADTNLTPSQFTLEAWVKVSTTGLNTIVSRGDGDSTNTDYILQLSNDGGNTGNEVSLFAGKFWDVSSSSIPLNTWTHVAVSFDGSNKLFYINGVLDRAAPRTNAIVMTASSPFYIGRQGSVCNCNFFNGNIAEVRIWNTIRSANQIQADMNSSFWGRQPGLVAYYHLNEGGGTAATDETGNGHTGTLSGGASWATTTPPSLGTITATERPAAGADSVVLSSPGAAWTATTVTPWLHLSTANKSGTGNTNVIFTFDANTGATRTGTLTIAGITLTVTQAGSNYVAVSAVTALPFPPSWPYGVAVDGAGNVYTADNSNNIVTEWEPASNSLTNLVISDLNSPYAVAVDGMGNVYIADTFNNAIKEWSVTNQNVTTLFSSTNSFLPFGIGVDGAGNVYFDDTYNYSLIEWLVTNHSTNLLIDTTYFLTFGAAADRAGNVYYSDGEVYELLGGKQPPIGPFTFAGRSVAVDGAGNVYAIDSNGTVQEWLAASNSVNSVTFTNVSLSPWGIAVDSAENLYLADPNASVVGELPHAYLVPTAKWETLAAGSDALPPIVPITASLITPFAPSAPTSDTNDPPWLTITSVTNGVVNFAFAGSTTNRVGNIVLLGQSIPIIQFNDMLSTNVLYVGPTAGSNGVVLTVNPAATQEWTANSPTSWLHPAAASGSGSGTVSFTFDANHGGQRTGTMTIAGQTLTVVQSPTPSSGTPSILSGAKILGDGSFQFSFTNSPGASFTVLFTTNLLLPMSSWTPLGAPIENPPGQYLFTDPTATNSQGFYNVSSP